MKWKQLLVLIVLIVLLGWFASVSPLGAIISVLVLVFGFPVYRLIKDRDQFLHLIRTMEVSIFNKPLDKNMWEKDELKHTKVKFTWKKKKKEFGDKE